MELSNYELLLRYIFLRISCGSSATLAQPEQEPINVFSYFLHISSYFLQSSFICLHIPGTWKNSKLPPRPWDLENFFILSSPLMSFGTYTKSELRVSHLWTWNMFLLLGLGWEFLKSALTLVWLGLAKILEGESERDCERNRGETEDVGEGEWERQLL